MVERSVMKKTVLATIHSAKMAASQVDAEKLIELVRRFPYLYDLSHPDFKDTQTKENTWKSIGEKLGVTGDVAMKKWVNLRDRYGKLKKDHDGKLRSGAAAVPPVSWIYFKILESVLSEKKSDARPVSNLVIADEEPSLALIHPSTAAQADDSCLTDAAASIPRARDQDNDDGLSQLRSIYMDTMERLTKQPKLDRIDMFFNYVAASVRELPSDSQNRFIHQCQSLLYQFQGQLDADR
ncbi:transcription factor Adf-1-like [Ornithodoros turicata]|uniref:transcription factor Adf-1-like n=1 Tax=Ornithodoros turicata TaxID=34597 RepID=UPI0031391501